MALTTMTHNFLNTDQILMKQKWGGPSFNPYLFQQNPIDIKQDTAIFKNAILN